MPRRETNYQNSSRGVTSSPSIEWTNPRGIAAMRKRVDKRAGWIRFGRMPGQLRVHASPGERRLLLRDPLQGIKCSGWGGGGGGGVPPLYRLAVALKPTKDKPLFITGLKGLPQGVVFTENKITLQLLLCPIQSV